MAAFKEYKREFTDEEMVLHAWDKEMIQNLVSRFTFYWGNGETERAIRELFGAAGRNPTVLPTFCCDNGKNIRVGENFLANYNVTILDIAPVTIGDNSWIGCNVVILRGTSIGKNCIVGAGSVLKGTYPDNSVIVQKRQTTVTVYPTGTEK